MYFKEIWDAYDDLDAKLKVLEENTALENFLPVLEVRESFLELKEAIGREEDQTEEDYILNDYVADNMVDYMPIRDFKIIFFKKEEI